MKYIRIARLSGGEKLYTSFSFSYFSEIKSDQNSVYLYFDALPEIGSLVPDGSYYGTVVQFTKTGYGYQLYQEILLSITHLADRKIVTLDYTTDSLVSLSISPVYSLQIYGSFYDTTTQTNAGPTAANVITYNSTEFSNGVSIVNSSQITFQASGVYDIQFSAQFERGGGGAGESTVEIWLSRNGSNVPWSSTALTITGNNGKAVAAWDFLVYVTAPGEYYQLYWYSSDTNVDLYSGATGSNPDRPAIPSIILTVIPA
jgi:hypothetical protein